VPNWAIAWPGKVEEMKLEQLALSTTLGAIMTGVPQHCEHWHELRCGSSTWLLYHGEVFEPRHVDGHVAVPMFPLVGS
jgi:hypothetical protein